MIAPGLEVMAVPIAALVEDPRNARLHDRANIAAVKASLQTFGQRKPIVVREGVVVAGNGTLRAALELGWDRIAAVEAKDLSPEEARAFAIADNKTAELAEWDFEALGNAFREMGSSLASATGFDAHEIERLAQTNWTPGVASGEFLFTLTFRVSAAQADLIRSTLAKRMVEGGAEGAALAAVCEEYLSAQQS